MFDTILFYLVIINIPVTDGDAGGVVFQISEGGLNKVIQYIMDVELPKFLSEYEFQNISQVIRDDLSLDVYNMTIKGITGQQGVIEIGTNNTVALEFSFQKLEVAALVNLNLGDQEDSYQNVATTIDFLDAILSLTLKLEHNAGNTNSFLSLMSCSAIIRELIPDGELRLLFELGLTESELEELIVSDVCPSLEDIVNENLDELLDIADKFEGSVGGTPLQTTLFLKTFGIEDKSMYFIGYVVVTTVGMTARKPSESLSISFTSGGREVYLLFNDAVLNAILNLKFEQNDIFLQTIPTENLGAWTFIPDNPSLTLQVSPSLIKLSLISNLTINSVNGSDTLTATLNGQFPMLVKYNDTLLEGEIASERITMTFYIQSASQIWMNYNTEQKCDILVDYFHKIKTVTGAYHWNLVIPERRDYGVEDLDLKLQQDSFKIGSNIHLGRAQGGRSMAMKSMVAPAGVGKLTLYESNEKVSDCYIHDPGVNKAGTHFPSLILVYICCIIYYLSN